MRKHIIWVLLVLMMTACTDTATTPTATEVAIIKVLATVDISPTPNIQEAAATRAAASPTFAPSTATIIPTETPYIGIFIGEAEPDGGLEPFREPLFASNEATAEPTANATRCNIPIDSPYVTIWQTTQIVNQRLGCPIQGGFGLFGNIQLFENGVMYYYPDLNAVWAIVPGAGNSPRFEYLENPPDASTAGMQAPNGTFVPTDEFGAMWMAVPDLQERIGFALTEPRRVPLNLQRFENGIFLHDVNNEQLFGLVIDGTVLGPYLAPPPIEPESTP